MALSKNALLGIAWSFFLLPGERAFILGGWVFLCVYSGVEPIHAPGSCFHLGVALFFLLVSLNTRSRHRTRNSA
jgi:hypothetical protein